MPGRSLGWVPTLILALRTHAFGESNEPILNHSRLVKCDLPHTRGGPGEAGPKRCACAGAHCLDGRGDAEETLYLQIECEEPLLESDNPAIPNVGCFRVGDSNGPIMGQPVALAYSDRSVFWYHALKVSNQCASSRTQA